MWANKNITLEVIEETKNKSGKGFVFRSGADGSSSAPKDTGFNDARWGDATRDYVTSACTLSKDALKQICKAAKLRAKATQKSGRAPSPSTSGPSKPQVGRRALLVDVPIVEDNCK